MRKYILLCLLAFNLQLLTLNLKAQTTVPGGVVNGTWTLAGSPYNVQGSIQIVNGDSLIIQPGVTVNFQGKYKLDVQGRLLAIGTVNDTILFTAANTTNGWYGIRFNSTPSTNDTSKIIYCKLQYGKTTNNSSPSDYGGAIFFETFSKMIIAKSRISYCTGTAGGGGIYCSNSSPIISNNYISSNTGYYGGGIYCDSSNPTISYNTISYNSTSGSYGGGGIYCSNSNPMISNNIIFYNTAPYPAMGGGISSFSSSPIISNNTITNNSSSNGGGGIYCQGNTQPISNNIISNNSTDVGGGGIEIVNGNSSIEYNIISNNTANNYGGGINCSGTSATISNNIISNNFAASYGGGIAFMGACGNSVIRNNTIVNNNAANGGAIHCDGGSGINNPTLRNCILWGNTASTSGAQVYFFHQPCDLNLYFCDVQGGSAAFELNGNPSYTGTYQNNIDTNALFVSPSGGSGTGFNGVSADWSLLFNSPCIDNGDPNGTYPATDIAGNPRVSGGRIDIGAYEFQGSLGLTTNNNSAGINVYPNPSNGLFTISFGHPELGSGSQMLKQVQYDVSIYNMLGEKIYFQNINGQTSNEIDISNAPKGIYFVNINDGTNIRVRKIVVE